VFQSLEDFCFRFALNHLTQVTQTEAFAKLDGDVMREFIRKAGLAGAFRY
jgi:RCC1 and BTB domain-containing protein